MLLNDLVDRNLGSAPRATAVEYGRHKFTWRELDTRIRHVASGLRAARVQPGDRFAVLAHNHPVCIEAVFAAALTGTTAVVVNWRLSEREVVAILQQQEIKLLFIGHEFADLLERIRPELDDLASWVVVGTANPQSHGSDDYEMWLEMHETGESMYDAAQHHPDVDDLVLHAHLEDERDNVALSHRHLFQGVEALPPTAGADCLLEEPLFLVRGMVAALHGMRHGSRTVLLSQTR
ncbi:MAG TPA: AMP-binding protein [Actinocrinis sp.]|nr:AMP-binding protein [Actinocrinis sp.]